MSVNHFVIKGVSMNHPDSIVDRTVSYVKETLADAEGGHDWYHIERVWKMARHLRDLEGNGEMLTIDLAALLHDISDAKFNGGNEEEGAVQAFNFLLKNGVKEAMARHIETIIKYVSFKGGFPQECINSIEFRIVQDADRLDAIGAIGIARAFNYGGFKNRPIYNPSIPLQVYADSETYHRSNVPTINHFYEKLLKLKDLMNTEAGKLIAEERHNFMLHFLETFYKEGDPGGSLEAKTGNSD